MIVKTSSVDVYASCEHILELLSHRENLSRLLNNIIEFKEHGISLYLRSEVKDRTVHIDDVKFEASTDRIRVVAYNDLGIQSIFIEITCRALDRDRCVLSMTIALNPVGLGVSSTCCSIALNTMSMGLKDRVLQLLRERLVESIIAEKLLQGDIMAKVIARGSTIIHKQSKGIDVYELIKSIREQAFIISITGEKLDAKIAVVGSYYAAKLTINSSEYSGEKALDILRSTDRDLSIVVYDATQILPVIR